MNQRYRALKDMTMCHYGADILKYSRIVFRIAVRLVSPGGEIAFKPSSDALPRVVAPIGRTFVRLMARKAEGESAKALKADGEAKNARSAPSFKRESSSSRIFRGIVS